ncbi:MAG: hypothetical protein JNL74_21895, partial [Fibrobacteres bacterium]|nr:hypothetical protein [Fibrobacterota bacterium]
MKWIKKGLVFFTDRQAGWMNSHAQCPTAIVLKDRIRIYFSARLPNQQSLPTFIDVEIDNPLRIMNINKIPILEMGRKGTFDENGIIPSYIVRKDNKVYLYYAGWSQCKNVPYKNFTGLAISSDEGETFEKYSEAPVFTMNEHNPLSATGPCIVQIENKYRALYSTGVDWVQVEDKLEHTYLLTDACSEDGVFWKTSGKIVVNPVFENEADCKPAVFKHGGLYHLW